MYVPAVAPPGELEPGLDVTPHPANSPARHKIVAANVGVRSVRASKRPVFLALYIQSTTQIARMRIAPLSRSEIRGPGIGNRSPERCVETVNMEVADEFFGGVTDEGEKLQEDPAGKPEHANCTT